MDLSERQSTLAKGPGLEDTHQAHQVTFNMSPVPRAPEVELTREGEAHYFHFQNQSEREEKETKHPGAIFRNE